MRVVMIIEMSWQVNEEVSRDMTGEADGKNPPVEVLVEKRDFQYPRSFILHDHLEHSWIFFPKF